MKKWLVVMVVLLLSVSMTAQAAELGVQIIGGQTEQAETVSLDDIKIDVPVDIYGFGTINPSSYVVQDRLVRYKKGSNNSETFYSGNEAEYILLKMDITNTTAAAKNYLADAEIKVVFQDNFEFAGWAYQYNWDKSSGDKKYSANQVIHPEDNYSIDPWYVGHYCFGCTLPNAVVDSKLPLRMEIKIGGNEITYNIRK